VSECLLRMLDESGRLVPAGDFIPAAEKLGLIRMVDRRTLELALEELEACPDLQLAVNLSGMTVVDPSTLTQLLGLGRDAGRVAERLTFEITETVAVQDIRDSVHMVERLKELGCTVALDDFGAGYTSYRYLKTLDVDLMKIDGQFVQGLDSNRDNDLFVRTLIDLAHGFDVRVVAESIETEADALALRRRGVDYLQGYYFGRPEIGRPWQAANPPPLLAALGG